MEAVMDNLQGKPAIEDKLRHIVPPQVRAMQVEIKQKLQEIINTQFENDQKSDAEVKKFLSQYGLP